MDGELAVPTPDDRAQNDKDLEDELEQRVQAAILALKAAPAESKEAARDQLQFALRALAGVIARRYPGKATPSSKDHQRETGAA